MNENIFNKIEDYLFESTINNRKSYKLKKSNYNVLIRFLSDTTISNLNQLNFEFGKKMIKWYFKNTKSKNSTINKNIGYLKTMLRYYNKLDNTFLLVKKLKNDTEPFKATNHKTLIKMMQYAKSLNNANSIIYYSVLRLLYDTGCRIGELLEIKKSNIDESNKIITLESTTTKASVQRVVFYSNINVDLINDLINLNDSKYLFYNMIQQRQLTYYDIKNFYRDGKKKMNIKQFHSHQIRKTMATDLVENGANLKTVQTILGHSDQKTTEIYINYKSITAKKEYDKIMNKINLD